ncbi:MAG: cytochrome c biogenesis CcdA family protein [Candidatus Geothermarchaeales archaeon]
MALEADLAFSFTLGVFSLLSPCAFPLLPGYISYLLGSGERKVGGMSAGLTVTLGMVTSLALLGIAVAMVGGVLLSYVPYLELVVGISIIAFGLLMVAEIPFPAIMPIRGFSGGKQGVSGLYTFGFGYGLAVSTCSAPIFFTLLAFSLVQGFLIGVGTFVFYALGMGAVFVVITLFIGEARSALTQKMGRLTFWLHRIGGLGLVGAGIYLLYIFFSANPIF